MHAGLGDGGRGRLLLLRGPPHGPKQIISIPHPPHGDTTIYGPPHTPSQPPTPVPPPQVFAVVFDEFHYMNDPDRGTVWEESVILSPPHILFVALSATIANVNQVRSVRPSVLASSMCGCGWVCVCAHHY